jgi:hypothetical protein
MLKKKKMGRPKLPKGEARAVFPLRLSSAERALYEASASAKGMSLPNWIRTTLTDASKT